MWRIQLIPTVFHLSCFLHINCRINIDFNTKFTHLPRGHLRKNVAAFAERKTMSAECIHHTLPQIHAENRNLRSPHEKSWMHSNRKLTALTRACECTQMNVWMRFLGMLAFPYCTCMVNNSLSTPIACREQLWVNITATSSRHRFRRIVHENSPSVMFNCFPKRTLALS